MIKYDVWLVFGGLIKGNDERRPMLVPDVIHLPDTWIGGLENTLLNYEVPLTTDSLNALKEERDYIVQRMTDSFFVALKQPEENPMAAIAKRRTAEKRALRRAYLLLHELQQEEEDEDLIRGLALYYEELNTVIEMIKKCDFLLPGDE